MGHTRLGRIPKSRKWTAVLGELDAFENKFLNGEAAIPDAIAAIAARTLDAADAGLTKAVSDEGLRYSFYLLTQLALSARSNDWTEGLRNLGIELSETSSVLDLTSEVQSAVDRRLSAGAEASDVSEMAQGAMGEAICELAGTKADTLFGTGPNVLQEAIRRLSTKKGFAELGQVFFGRFISRFLNFYLSRVTAGRLSQVGDVSSFNRALRAHCEQSARVVHDFCGEWYSKTEYVEGIGRENSARFVAVAVKKLQAELRQQRTET
jgi:hypothetical protein